MPSNSAVIAVLPGIIGLIFGAGILLASPVLARIRVPETPAPPPEILIPIVGALRTGWRPVRSIAFELLTGALFAGLYLHYGLTARLPLAAVFTVLLLLIAVIDLEHRLILNVLSLPGTVGALLLSPLWPGLGPESAAQGAVIAFLIFLVIQLIGRGALGMGDTKLAMLIGAMRGMPGMFNALMTGVIIGGLGALVFLIVLRRGRKEYMAYGPYLAAGAILSFFLNQP